MKIGNYSIPRNRLAPLLIDVKKIYEQFRSEEVRTEFIAHTLNQAPRGGAFLQKMADLRSYGLLEGRGDANKVTELGKQATYGHDEERLVALEKLVKNIPLWSILSDKYGISIKEENFWIDLMKITGAERLDSQKHAEYIRNAYIADVNNIVSVEKPIKPIPIEPVSIQVRGRDRKDDMEITSKDAVVYIKYPSIGTINIDLSDETNLLIAEQFLNKIKAKLQKQEPIVPPEAPKQQSET